MKEYKFKFISSTHFVNSFNRMLKNNYGEEYILTKEARTVLVDVYNYENKYGEDFHYLGYRRPYNTACAILMNYNRNYFTQRDVMAWIIQIIMKTVCVYNRNESLGLMPRDLSKKELDNDFNAYVNFLFIDDIGILEGSEIIYDKDMIDVKENKSKLLQSYKNECDEYFKKSGVYMFYSKNQELLYIGKSINLSSRLITSAEEKVDAMYVTIMETKTYADTGVYEMYYIAKLKPKLNVDGKTRDELTIELPNIEPTLKMFKIR